MRKSELVTSVVNRLPYLTQKDAEIIVNTMFDCIKDGLAQGERVDIRGFGSFSVRLRAPREGRNPRTGETVPVPEKRLPRFKVGKALHDRMNPGPAE